MAGDPLRRPAPAPALRRKCSSTDPEKPVAPPFPFKYAGWFQEGRVPAKVYLSRGDAVSPISRGRARGFRIDAVQDERHRRDLSGERRQSSLPLASLSQQAAAPAELELRGSRPPLPRPARRKARHVSNPAGARQAIADTKAVPQARTHASRNKWVCPRFFMTRSCGCRSRPSPRISWVRNGKV